MSALRQDISRKAFFQRHLCVREPDLDDIFAVPIAVGISDLADKINGAFPFGQ